MYATGTPASTRASFTSSSPSSAAQGRGGIHCSHTSGRVTSTGTGTGLHTHTQAHAYHTSACICICTCTGIHTHTHAHAHAHAHMHMHSRSSAHERLAEAHTRTAVQAISSTRLAQRTSTRTQTKPPICADTRGCPHCIDANSRTVAQSHAHCTTKHRARAHTHT